MHYIFIASYLAATFAVSKAEPEIDIPTPPEGYFHVTLLVYANLRDPVWKFGQCLNQGIQNLLLQAKKNGYVYDHACIPKKTGFKGFLVQDATGEQLIVGPETIELQLLLLDTMPSELPPIGDYRQRIKSVIASGIVSADCTDTNGNKSYELPYYLERWNFNENIRRKNNGYNYINDLMSNSYMQPGRASGQIYSQISGDQIRDAAVRDGLTVLNPHPAANDTVATNLDGDLDLVALFVAPGNCHMGGDFHWYRLDDKGTWSHKPGQTGATHLDDANRPITDPRTADTGVYNFVCFMTINHTAPNDTKGRLKETPVLNCKDLLEKNSSSSSGTYWIDPNSGSPNDAFQAYCDQTTHGGGWTLVWSYTFTAYEKFNKDKNAVTPRPTWDAKEANIRQSITVPLGETHYEAMKFSLWHTIGNEVLIKSNINNWITCKEVSGSIVRQRNGAMKCEIVLPPLVKGGGVVPHILEWLPSGPSLRGPKSHFYRFDGSTKKYWPTHDPLGVGKSNQLQRVENARGNIFVR